MDGRLEVHHKDENSENNCLDNLIKVCCKCHNLLHHGWYVGTRAIKDKITSIKHVSKEDVYDLEMNAPYHNYVANGFIMHNSTRYCNYGNEKEITVIIPFQFEEGSLDYNIWHNCCNHAEIAYLALIKNKMSPQWARSVLPNSLKTEIVVTYNLREWRHFFKLRAHKTAHPQMVEIVIPLLRNFQKLISIIFDDINEEFIKEWETRRIFHIK